MTRVFSYLKSLMLVEFLLGMNGREAFVLVVFALGVLALGVYPKPLTDLMNAPIAQLVTQLAATKL